MIIVVTCNVNTGELGILAEGEGCTDANVARALVGAAQIANARAKEAAKPKLITPPTIVPNDIHNGGPK